MPAADPRRDGPRPGRAADPGAGAPDPGPGGGLPGASAAEDAWAAARASQPGWLTGPEADAALCDATVVPVVTGHVDWAALDQFTDAFLLARGLGRHAGRRPASHRPGTGQPGGPAQLRSGPASPASRQAPQPGLAQPARTGQHAGRCSPRSAPVPARAPASPPCRRGQPNRGPSLPGRPAHRPAAPARPARSGCRCEPARDPAPLSPATRDRLRRALLGLAADALSGPDGLAARLRAALDGRPLTTVSLPLDIGAATETIPAHLRRAATTRHPHCAFPGCDQPASVCDIHHLIPRARGGPTSLPNLVPLCAFHHLTAIHRWGWNLTLHSDGTTTATSPDGQRTLHSHSPPGHSPPACAPPSHAA